MTAQGFKTLGFGSLFFTQDIWKYIPLIIWNTNVIKIRRNFRSQTHHSFVTLRVEQIVRTQKEILQYTMQYFSSKFYTEML
jgi:hypothetical protein